MTSPRLTGQSVLRRVWQVSHELPEEERVAFFDEAASELVVVNAVGGAIWQLLDGESSVRELSELIAEEVQGAPDAAEVERALLGYLKALLERGAVEEVGDRS